MTVQLGRRSIPVFRPAISEEEIDMVTTVLRSGWIGPGPRVAEFERSFATSVGATHAVSTCSGTAALRAALLGAGVQRGDEIILPSFSYISAFQVLLSLGAVPVFADIESTTLTLDPSDVARRLTPRTRGILTVHHGGQLCDVDGLATLADAHGLWVIDDAAHAAGARYGGRPVGSLARATCFSFGAVKNLTTGDGGMVTTNDGELARRIAAYRSLGLDNDTWARYSEGNTGSQRWAYNVDGIGDRLHMNDIAAALGLVQLRRLHALNAVRRALVQRYETALENESAFSSIRPRPGSDPSWHMYTVLMDEAIRDRFVDSMREQAISVGVHYYPVHLYQCARPYQTRLPVTESIWKRVTTFPLYPTMTYDEQNQVIDAALAAVRS